MKSLLAFVLSLYSAHVLAQGWQVNSNVTDHDIYPGQNCVASTDKGTIEIRSKKVEIAGGAARIEIVANADSTGASKEPFIELVVAKGEKVPEGFTAVVKGKKGSLSLDRIFFDNAPEKMVFISRLDDRKAVIDTLLELLLLELSVKNKDGTVISLVFSLKNSARIIEQQFSDCKLGFLTHNPL